MRDSSRAPGPQSRQRAKQQGLAGSGFTNDENALPRLDLNLLFLEHGAAGRRGNLEAIDGNHSRLTCHEVDPTFDVVQYIRLDDRAAETCDPQQSRTPIGNRAEVVDEPAQR